MRRTPLLALLLPIALLLAACASSAEPGWTFAPPTEPPAATEAPSPGEPTTPPAETGAPEGVIVLTAQNIQWVERELSAPADQPFVIRLVNNDANVPHNVEIKQGSAVIYMGDIFNGVETRDFEIPALAAGVYQYICTVHPNMTGTLTVGG